MLFLMWLTGYFTGVATVAIAVLVKEILRKRNSPQKAQDWGMNDFNCKWCSRNHNSATIAHECLDMQVKAGRMPADVAAMMHSSIEGAALSMSEGLGWTKDNEGTGN